jgi:predicted DNA-binding transcriptional regulator AlpA
MEEKHNISARTSKSRITKLQEVMYRTSLSKSKIYRDMKTGKFPPQAKKMEGSTSAGWYEDDIDEFIDARRPKSSLYESQASPKGAQQGDVVNLAIHHQDRENLHLSSVPKPQAKSVEHEQRLIRTGMKLDGADVYWHPPTGKLVVFVGSMPDEWLSGLGMSIGPDQNVAGGNLRS